MKLSNVRIKNYRTVRSEVYFDFSAIVSIVGPNNSGKSNIIRAIQTFFSGRHNNIYRVELDRPFDLSRERTSITVAFEPDGAVDQDNDFVVLHDELRELHVEVPSKSDYISVHVYFTENDKPVYSFFPNSRRPKDAAKNARYSSLQNQLLDKIFDTYKVFYIPSAKSFSQIFEEHILPEVGSKLNNRLSTYVPDLNSDLLTVSSEINKHLKQCGLEDITADLSISENSLSALVRSINFLISDHVKTEFSRKGTGVQSAAVFAALLWIDETLRGYSKRMIWLIEEPESYLHPELTEIVNRLIAKMAQQSNVILTTHSMSFVPREVEKIVGCNKLSGATSLHKYSNFHEATDRIRRSLGVKFSDYYSLGNKNIAVEGKTDRSIFEEILEHCLKSGIADRDNYNNLLQSKFVTFGGVKQLSSFLMATFEFIAKEVKYVSVFDGDFAGVKERQALQGYFGQKKIRFESNKDYISVRNGYAIEGLFPDGIILEVHKANPDYFKTFSIDAAGDVEPFQIEDHKKSQVQQALLDKLKQQKEPEHFVRFVSVFDALEKALA